MIQAVEAYRSVSASDELRELERMRDRARRNEASALAYERRQIAKKFKDNGVDVDTIARSAGLTVDEVLKL